MVGFVLGGTTNLTCVCGCDPRLHARDGFGQEVCSGRNGDCQCKSYVSAQLAPPCLCGHMAAHHTRRGFGCRFHAGSSGCGCDGYRFMRAVGPDLIARLAERTEVVVVIVPREVVAFHEYRDIAALAGDISNAASTVFVQHEGGVYFVGRHQNKERVGGYWITQGSATERALAIYDRAVGA